MEQKEESELAKYIKQRAAELGLNLSKLAKEAGISRPTLYGLLDGSTGEAKISTLVGLASVLRVHPVVLFRYLLAELEFANFSTVSAKYRCDGSGFVADVTIPDNSMVTTDSVFVKTWDIQNIGLVDWIGRKLVCLDRKADWNLMSSHVVPPQAERGLIPEQNMVDIPDTLSGETVRLSVTFTAPSYPCTVVSYWKMVDEAGDLCFPESQGLSCLVRVVSL